MNLIDTTRPPQTASKKAGDARPALLQTEHHHLCPGCGHPVGVRMVLEVLDELGLASNSVCAVGHGCYGVFHTTMDVESMITLHGRPPAFATGIKRMRPDCAVWTMQGDGDMVSEGLAEVMHTAARGEKITCILLNNGVFGDTGGQMTGATVVGQRTKNTLEGRAPEQHGYPIPIADIIAQMPGVAYVGRGAVNTAGGATKVKRMIRKAFEYQMAGKGFTLVEVLTMCPTGWFVSTPSGPDYLSETLQKAYPLGEIKDVGA
jgi:2-oxoglutarate ferredoxin oxidoreductase subunit beta